jgi:hypothetical protein
MKTFAKIWLAIVVLVGLWALVFHPLYLLIAVVFGLGGGGFTWHCVKVLLTGKDEPVIDPEFLEELKKG